MTDAETALTTAHDAFIIQLDPDELVRFKQAFPAKETIALATQKYKEPASADKLDIPKCRAIDAENGTILEHNRRIVNILNPILVTLYQRPIAARNPDTCWEENARTARARWLKDPGVRLSEAIKFLHKRGRFNLENLDSILETAPTLADDIAFQETVASHVEYWRKRNQPTGLFPVRVGDARTLWDGVSACDNSGNRFEWQRGSHHSFMDPHVVPAPVKDSQGVVLRAEDGG